MANTTTFKVGEGFDINSLIKNLEEKYESMGFKVDSYVSDDSAELKLAKDDDGIKKFIGLALGIKVNFSLREEKLVVDFTDAEWVGKIVGLAVGWFLCLIPAFFAGYGAYKQYEFPKTIESDIKRFL